MRYATAARFRQALEDRIREEAQKEGSFSLVRLRKFVVFDRFLARLLAAEPEGWVLKGGVALNLRWQHHARSTKDLDIGRRDTEEEATEHLASAAALTLDDFFIFRVERTGRLDAMAEGAAIRYSVTAELAGRRFEGITVDIGFGDPLLPEPDVVPGMSFLEFAGIERLSVPTVALEQHIAEKVHAYTRNYTGGGSTRVKDLVDLVLAQQYDTPHAGRLRLALVSIFDSRGSHALPDTLQPPPPNWAVPYRKMAQEVGLPSDDGASDVGADHQRVVLFLRPILGGTAPDETRWDPTTGQWAPVRTGRIQEAGRSELDQRAEAMKIFISSVIGGFGEYREAAASAVRLLDHDPKRAEDYGASPESPQQLCLKGVRDADAIVLLLGERYGDRQPSGVSATHEEFREAQREGKDILAFVQQGVEPEPDQQEFIREVQGWVEGRYTGKFTTPADLRDAVTQCLHVLELNLNAGKADEEEVLARAREAIPNPRNLQIPTLYVAVAGGPRRQVLSPMDLEGKQLQRRLIELATVDQYPIFDFLGQTRPSPQPNALRLEQNQAAISVDELGTVTVQQLAQNRTDSAFAPFSEMMGIVREEVQRRIERAVLFTADVLDDIDGPHRLSDVVVVAAILGMQYETWRSEAEQRSNPNVSSMSLTAGQPMRATLRPPLRRRSALRAQVREIAAELTTRLRHQA